MPEALCLRPWLCLVRRGIHPGAMVCCSQWSEREGRSVLILVIVLTAFTPEDRSFWVLPVGLDDVEVDALDDFLTGDLVAAIAAPEGHVWLYACF